MTLLIQKIFQFLQMCLSDSGMISFGRSISAFITVYFLTQDAWFFHRTGKLVDNVTLLTQASLMTMFYLQTKAASIAEKAKKDEQNPLNGQPEQK